MALLGIVAYIVKISSDYAKLKAEKEELKRDIEQVREQYNAELQIIRTDIAEQKAKVSENFKALYHSRSETQNALTELTTTVKLLVQSMDKQFSTIDKKLDEIQNRINGGR